MSKTEFSNILPAYFVVVVFLFYRGTIKYLHFLFHVLSGASDQCDLLLSQLEEPPAMELRRAGAGPQVQGGDPQSGKVFSRTADRIWLQLLTCM